MALDLSWIGNNTFERLQKPFVVYPFTRTVKIFSRILKKHPILVKSFLFEKTVPCSFSRIVNPNKKFIHDFNKQRKQKKREGESNSYVMERTDTMKTKKNQAI